MLNILPHRARALTRYYYRVFRRRVIVAPYIIFGVSLYLFLVALIPGFDAPLRAMGLDVQHPERHSVSGIVTTTSKGSIQPVAQAQIMVGGYATTTDQTGAYKLQFLSPHTSKLAITVSVGETTTTEIIDVVSRTISKNINLP